MSICTIQKTPYVQLQDHNDKLIHMHLNKADILDFPLSKNTLTLLNPF